MVGSTRSAQVLDVTVGSSRTELGFALASRNDNGWKWRTSLVLLAVACKILLCGQWNHDSYEGLGYDERSMGEGVGTLGVPRGLSQLSQDAPGWVFIRVHTQQTHWSTGGSYRNASAINTQ